MTRAVWGRLVPSSRTVRSVRSSATLIYQDALSSLNPAMTIRAPLRRRGGTRTPAGPPPRSPDLDLVRGSPPP
ncbi:hypothetical protein [Actinomadura sp. 3N407]|uniref:hypothetical protein n=1 Tax=Actinomadura sp. 3N407 TaxID=3457423 RepID=UPI003FCC56CC